MGTFIFRAPAPVKPHTCEPPYNPWAKDGDQPTHGSLWLCDVDHVLWKFDLDKNWIGGWVQVRGKKRRAALEKWMINELLPGPFKPLKVNKSL